MIMSLKPRKNMANLISRNVLDCGQTMDNLRELLGWIKRMEPDADLPDVDISCFPAHEQDAAAAIVKLLQERRSLQYTHNRRMATVLADADALLESLVHIGLGDFSNPVSSVSFKGLRNIRIGIEDMQLQLRRSHEELNELIEELRQSEERFRQLVESTSDWIWEIDRDGRYRYASPQVELILGYAPEEIVGRTPFEMMPDDEAERVIPIFKELIRTGSPINQLQNVNFHKDGHKVVLESSGRPFFDENGRISGYRGVDRDITDRKRMEQELRHLATHDPLTGLHNRLVFQQRIQDEIERADRYGHSLALFMLDIDLFKKVNDRYGHCAGDAVLKAFARVLRDNVRATDFVARYGGEEFTVLLPETSLDAAAVLADRLRRVIGGYPFQIADDRALKIKTSIGVATFPTYADDWQSLLNAADKALYYAKGSGRNRVKTIRDGASGQGEPAAQRST